MKNLFSVEGKVAVITGGSRGIGEMFARGFVENGVKTYITARKIEELEETAKRLSEYGECYPVVADLSALEGIETLFAAVAKREHKMDILINNAGAAWGASIADFPESGWDKVVDLNVKSPFFLIQKFLPLLRAAASEEDPARVVNVSSIAGLVHPKMATYSYAASKAAMIHMTRHMAADLAAENININGIAPGPFPSSMTKSFISKDGKVDGLFVPRKRAGLAEDAAGAAIYLSSRASAWITGHTIVLDGGIVANAG